MPKKPRQLLKVTWGLRCLRGLGGHSGVSFPLLIMAVGLQAKVWGHGWWSSWLPTSVTWPVAADSDLDELRGRVSGVKGGWRRSLSSLLQGHRCREFWSWRATAVPESELGTGCPFCSLKLKWRTGRKINRRRKCACATGLLKETQKSLKTNWWNYCGSVFWSHEARWRFFSRVKG